MSKLVKRILIALGVVVALVVGAMAFLNHKNRTASPPAQVTYSQNGYDLKVAYSRPTKKGREIFGKLVPYGKVWRTGANEATLFTTGTPLTIGGKALPAGTYSVFTIPEASAWTVIFNKGEYMWGINMDKTSPRKPEDEVLQVVMPVTPLATEVEPFTIAFEDGPALAFSWDKTSVRVPVAR